MNYRKIIILPAFALLTHILYIGCCKCIDSKNSFFEIHNGFVHVYGSNLVVIDTGIVTHADTVYLDYSFDVHCVAIQKNPFAAFVNLSYACKCDECGSMGLKDSIVSLNITSDTTYNGIEPGSSLNAFFKVVYSLSDTISVDSLKTYVNTNRSRMYAERMFTTTKPGNDKGHIFVLHIVFAGGREVFISSKTIFWT